MNMKNLRNLHRNANTHKELRVLEYMDDNGNTKTEERRVRVKNDGYESLKDWACRSDVRETTYNKHTEKVAKLLSK